jgi:prepilin-type N-terminal cleavage/methylation domain-containing protein
MDDHGGRSGFTLVEIMIALTIVGILVGIATSLFQGLMEKYRVEDETKRMFADLTDARGRAMQRNRVFFVQIGSNGYNTFEDTNPAPDGDGILDNTADSPAANVTGLHAITTSTAGLSSFRFNRNGIASATGTIRFFPTAQTQTDYDCITVRETRIKMGKWSGTACDEK